MNIQEKRYKISTDLELQEYTCVGKSGNSFVLHDQNGAEHVWSLLTVDQLNMSRRMVITELEEILRKKLDKVHYMMQELNINFDVYGSAKVFYKPHAEAKQVHKYDLKGRYIESYASVQLASRENGATSKRSPAIYRACIGERPTAFGFKWSYNKKEQL